MKMSKFFIIFIVLWTVTLATNSFAEEGVLKIVAMEGNVLVRIHPSEGWIGAKVGQTLDKNDAIKTEADGKVYMEFTDKSSLSLKPNTDLTAEELTLNATMRKINFNMGAGELKAVVKKANTPSEFKVKTPTAICGVRGSIPYIIVSIIDTRAYMEEGILYFTNTISGESREVGEGMTALSSADGSVSEPGPIPLELKNSIISGYLGGVVVEPYTEPVGDAGSTITAPEVQEENPASPV